MTDEQIELARRKYVADLARRAGVTGSGKGRPHPAGTLSEAHSLTQQIQALTALYEFSVYCLEERVRDLQAQVEALLDLRRQAEEEGT